MLLSVPPKYPLSSVMGFIKGKTAELKVFNREVDHLNGLQPVNFLTAKLNANRPMDRDTEFQRLVARIS